MIVRRKTDRLMQVAVLLAMMLPVTGCPERDKPADAGTTSAESARAGRPPIPNFREPVDYLEWWRRGRFQPEWPAGEEVYANLLFPADDVPFPTPSKAAASQLRVGATRKWSVKELAALAAYLDQIAPQIEAFALAAEHEHVSWLADPPGPSFWLALEVPGDASRLLSRATLARARMDAGGDGASRDTLKEACRTIFRHAHHMEQMGAPIPLLLGLGTRVSAYESIRSVMLSGNLDRTELANIHAILIEHPAIPSFADALRMEWAGLLDFLQQLYPAGRFSDDAVTRMKQNDYLPPGGMFLPSPEVTARGFDEWYRPLIRMVDVPWSLSVFTEMRALESARASRAEVNLILSTYIPATNRAYRFALRSETERRATELLLALCLTRNETGSWPASLDACPGDIGAIRIDPLSGRDFVYAVRDGAVTLYSVGFDGKDDGGGKHDRRWSTRLGYDVVFCPNPDRP